MELDSRKQRILQAIVQDYVATAEPVGSHILVQRYALGVKSATIRNEMAEMSERGYLRQPHTSAGRVPSDLGYRFYVNRLMVAPPLPGRDVELARNALISAESELEAILRMTCQLLTQMTHLPAVATPPEAQDETRLRQVFLSPTTPGQVLLVVLFSTGRTEHRLLTDLPLGATDALALANALNERFGDSALVALGRLHPDDDRPPRELAAFAPLWTRLVRELAQTARSVTEKGSVLVEGAQNVLAQPEFRDVERLSQFLSLLQERAALVELLEQELDSTPSATIRIGEELGRPELSGFSVVASPYFVGNRERGSLGVVGPTRMDYGHALACVQLMAQTVSTVLSRFSA